MGEAQTETHHEARILQLSQLSFADELDAQGDDSAADWRIVGPGVPVPKADATHAPDWARVGLMGFENWLRFWRLDGHRDPNLYPPVDDEYTPEYEPSAETLAIANLEADAQRWANAGHNLDVTLRHKQLIALERYFLKEHDTHKFRVKYAEFIRHKLDGLNPAATHRYQWIADRVGVEDWHSVIKELETASARLELLAGMGIEPIMNVPIFVLLNAKRTYTAETVTAAAAA